MRTQGGNCVVCLKNEATVLDAIPGLPSGILVARCSDCIAANAYPFELLAGATADCGGLEACDDNWNAIVKSTCNHLNKTADEFNVQVTKFAAQSNRPKISLTCRKEQ